LEQKHLQWLEKFETTAIAYEDFFLCHASPEKDTEYLLVEVRKAGVFPRESGDLVAKLPPHEQPIVLCGHDHVPRTLYVPDGRLVVNPGSVGLPAYTDDLPHPHAMEAGTPHARYSLISRNEAGWWVENVAVPYDWQIASSTALKNGRPDWAEWLSTGRASYR
jgi:hypothetical protein